MSDDKVTETRYETDGRRVRLLKDLPLNDGRVIEGVFESEWRRAPFWVRDVERWAAKEALACDEGKRLVWIDGMPTALESVFRKDAL